MDAPLFASVYKQISPAYFGAVKRFDGSNVFREENRELKEERGQLKPVPLSV